MPTDAEIEAAAKALAQGRWDWLSPERKNDYRADVAAALIAAEGLREECPVCEPTPEARTQVSKHETGQPGNVGFIQHLPETGQPKGMTPHQLDRYSDARRFGAEDERARIVALIEGKRVDDRADTLALHLSRANHNRAIDQILNAIQEDTDE